MRVSVNRDLCETLGNCMDVAPDVFDFGDDDRLAILLPEVTAEREEVVRLAVDTCPLNALRLED